MPPGMEKQDANRILEQIKELSIIARKIYTIYLIVIAYFVIVVASISDRQLLLLQTPPIRIFGIESLVGLHWLFIISPLIAISLFIYLQIYLLRIGGYIGTLPKQEKKYIYPWIINFVYHLDEGLLGKIQKLIIHSTLYYSLPILLTTLTLKSLKMHDVSITGSTVLMIWQKA